MKCRIRRVGQFGLHAFGRWASPFRAYPPREKWVGDAPAYRRALPKLFAYPPRERWVGGAPAYDETLPIKEVSLEGYSIRNPTSHEVGMESFSAADRENLTRTPFGHAP